jgi:hypothetical protein
MSMDEMFRPTRLGGIPLNAIHAAIGTQNGQASNCGDISEVNENVTQMIV